MKRVDLDKNVLEQYTGSFASFLTDRITSPLKPVFVADSPSYVLYI